MEHDWNMDPLKMYSLLKVGIFHCYVSLLEVQFCGELPCFQVVPWIPPPPPRMRTRGIKMFHVILVTIASWVKTLQ